MGIVANLAIGCSSAAEPQQVESWSQWDMRVVVSGPRPLVIALVVDDRATAEAAELRAGVDVALRTTLSRFSSPSGLIDPAAWRPVDVTVALGLPSGSDTDWLIGPEQVPALAYQTREPSPASTTALADTVRDQIGAHLAAPSDLYRPIEVTSRLARLLAREVVPVDDREAALIAATERDLGGDVAMALATTSDDESSGEVTAYPIPVPDILGESDYFVALTAVIPSAEPAPCPFLDPSGEPPSRLRSWIEAQSGLVDPQGWPCAAESLAELGLPPLGVSCGAGRSWCTSHPIAMDGPRAQCLVLVERPGADEPCDPERGWVDPVDEDGVRRPRTGENAWTDFRVCEVRQLEGTALEACRTTAACEGCPGGWCRAEWLSGEDLGGSADICIPGRHPSQLRFVGGAMAGARATFRLLCNLEP